MLPLFAVNPFGIHLVDGVGDPAPCVTLTTTDQQRFVSDDAGWVAFHEPGLMGEQVWFTIEADTYEVAPDVFGFRGVTLTPVEGQTTDVTVTKTGAPAACGLGLVNRAAVVNGLTDDPFEIEVVDAATGRGVPLVKVQGPSAEFWTDSAGRIAVRDPSLLGQTVDFTVPELHGYRYNGPALRFDVVEGGQETVQVTRVNVAERLYRVSGRGVYRDTVLLGGTPPVENPVLNGKVMGHEDVMVLPTSGRSLYVYNSTNRPGHPIGLQEVAGALATPLADPSEGVDLEYLVDPSTGLPRPMAPTPHEGRTTLGGAAVVDDGGVDRTIAFYTNTDAAGVVTERGVMVLDQALATFVIDTPWLSTRPAVGINLPLSRHGYAYVEEYMRFPATLAAAREPFRNWELLSPLLPDGSIDRWPDGDERWDWRPMLDGESPGEIGGDTLVDLVTSAEIEPHDGTVAWSPWRHRWQRIYTETGGTSLFGEMWYAEADTPYGPWMFTTKVATSTAQSSYRPFLHPELSGDGRKVLFEATFSSRLTTSTPTPRYDFNQLMYQVDLEDARMVLPTPVYEVGDRLATLADLRETDPEPVIAFYAPDRPLPDTLPVWRDGPACDGGALRVGGTPAGLAAFHVSRTQLAGTVPLWRATSSTGQVGLFVDVPSGWSADATPAGYVWENTDKRHSLVMDWLPEIRVDAGADTCVAETTPGAGILLPLDLSTSPGVVGGAWSIEVDGAEVATTARVNVPLSSGRHVIVATWTSDEGTPYVDERWVAVEALGGPDTGDTGDTDLPGDTGDTDAPPTDGTSTDDGSDEGGCNCATSPGAAGFAGLLPLGLLLIRRRRG